MASCGGSVCQDGDSIVDDCYITVSQDMSSRVQQPTGSQKPFKTHTYTKAHKKPREDYANISIIEWFNNSVENEMNKRRRDSLPTQVNVTPKAGTSHHYIVDASASGIEMQASLRGEMDTELMEAIDHLAKAEAIVAFEGAVKAAEQAAASAPPELAEEAAVAGAKGYQAELTSVVKKVVPGVRPLEVIGYVGITRPKVPKKPF